MTMFACECIHVSITCLTVVYFLIVKNVVHALLVPAAVMDISYVSEGGLYMSSDLQCPSGWEVV